MDNKIQKNLSVHVHKRELAIMVLKNFSVL